MEQFGYFAGKEFGSTENIILKSFEVGRGLEPSAEVDLDAKVSRSDLFAGLKAILSPAESKHYVVIVGEKGSG